MQVKLTKTSYIGTNSQNALVITSIKQ